MSNSSKLTKERKGAIALAKLKLTLSQKGFNLHVQNVRSQLGNAADELNAVDPSLKVSTEEIRQMMAELIEDLHKQCFAPLRSSDANSVVDL